MDTIFFSGVSADDRARLQRVFLLLKTGKENGTIEENLVRDALGNHLGHFVSDPALIQQQFEQWQRDRTTPLQWEFGSWIDAFANCELRFHSLHLREDGSGELHFEQLAWPSGGLKATEELIRAFGGHVVSNSAA